MTPERPTDTSFSDAAEGQPATKRVAIVAFALAGLLLAATAVFARTPEDVFGGSVRLFTRPIPRFASDSQATSFYRTAAVERVGRAADGTWQTDVVAFLEEPLGDFEVTFLFFDVSDGNRRLAQTTTAMVHERDTRTIRKRVTLREPNFHPRRWYEVVVTHRGQELTRGTQFFTDGVVDTGPQVISFTDDETAEGDAFSDL